MINQNTGTSYHDFLQWDQDTSQFGVWMLRLNPMLLQHHLLVKLNQSILWHFLTCSSTNFNRTRFKWSWNCMSTWKRKLQWDWHVANHTVTLTMREEVSMMFREAARSPNSTHRFRHLSKSNSIIAANSSFSLSTELSIADIWGWSKVSSTKRSSRRHIGRRWSRTCWNKTDALRNPSSCECELETCEFHEWSGAGK